MNREIKFRVWDSNQKKFTAIRQDDVIPPEDDVMDIFRDGIDEGFVFLQYTGLKDKHGVEIYEGDIVRYSIRYDMTNHSGNGLVEWFIPDKSNPNEFHHGEACYIINRNLRSNLIKVNNHLSLYRTHDKQVVGNIFETPELLK